ncbi:MAG: ribosome biogenesis GTP-binding protein YihA/YsxC [Oscillospiraceae bacterium]|nr:ribosome biogenesis GTP-binding protein YihA/YsxC [Oscillospiraceae bacterium]
MSINVHNVEFIKSAAAPSDLISTGQPQIVFSGKSNVGKSTVINKLLNRSNVARVSSVPGKTVHVNYFLIDKSIYFVDLPGYGYAKVPKAELSRWAKLMDAFFSGDEHISLGILIVDARHPPTGGDVTMSDWFKSYGCRYVVLANKVDKVKKSEVDANIERIRAALDLDDGTLVVPFSAKDGANRGLVLREIESAAEHWRAGDMS